MPGPSLLDDAAWTATAGPNGSTVYTELVQDGSPSFSFENDGSQITRTLLIRWQGNTPQPYNAAFGLDQAKRDFLGYPQINVVYPQSPSGTPAYYLSRNVPHSTRVFLRSDGKTPYLYATKMSGNGYGMDPTILAAQGSIHDKNTDTPIYRYAKCQVTYETLTYEVLTDDQMTGLGAVDPNGNPDEATLLRFCTVQVRPGMEYLTLPIGGFKFVGPTNAGSAIAVQGSPGKLVPNYDLSVTWHLVPVGCVGTALYNPFLKNPPPIDTCLGCVNGNTFPASIPGAPDSLQVATVAGGGANYAIGDVLTLQGGTLAPGISQSATLKVLSVNNGAITLAVPLSRSLYSSPPANPVAVSGGAGNGATFNCGFDSGLPIGSLLMTGADIRPVRSTAGDRLYDIEYRFKFLNVGNAGVQSLYYQGTAPTYNDSGYYEVTNTGTTNIGAGLFNNDTTHPPVNIYPWAAFDTLFRVPT